ncbi:ead/Ea22-like family protein [Salmonella enterica]|nr:ead/Ea22-like family protein [Salmonella enterica]
MSNIDKCALREVAEKATPGTWRRTSSLFNGITVTPFSLCGEEVTLAHTVEKRDAEFIAAANPATMLALLDENIQLQREKDAIEAVALALRDDMRQAREQLAAAEQERENWRISFDNERYRADKLAAAFNAECEKLVMANRSLITQHIRANSAESRIAELEAREVTLPAQRFCPGEYVGSVLWAETEIWNKAISACDFAVRAADIKVKE